MGRSDPALTSPPRAIEIWRARSDLRIAFDLTTPEGGQGLFWWYFLHGFRELGLTLLPEDGADLLNAPRPGIPQRGFVPITRLMFELYRRRPPVGTPHRGMLGRFVHKVRRRRKASDRLHGAHEQAELLAWYFTRALAEANLLDALSEAQAQALLESDDESPGQPRIVAMIWRADPDLQRRFPDCGDPRILAWCRDHGARDWPILAHPRIGIAARRDAAGRVRAPLPFGVNLFGHARARLGVGEDVRMAALTLTHAGVPHVICDVPAGQIAAEEQGLDDRISNAMPYAINLFCMTGMETISAMLARGRGHFEDHWNIGFWPWELPRWPDFWGHAYGYVDEIWASSHFAYEAFRHNPVVPVRQMPMVVTVDPGEGLGRQDFGLPTDQFLFCFAFDGLSSFQRKNPLACLAAFQAAFPDLATPVGLVLKGLRVEDHPQWQALRAAMRADPRIHLLTGSYTRGALHDLFRSTDCFLSLHRSEGFGRNIAEAMLLGKPVIATGWSGNADFTRPDTSFPVPCKLIELAEGDYPFCDGQVWAEPNIGAAAGLMRQVFSDARLRNQIATAGQKFIASTYAPDIVGRKYFPELETSYIKSISHRSLS